MAWAERCQSIATVSSDLRGKLLSGGDEMLTLIVFQHF
jgi:hypothetical protein